MKYTESQMLRDGKVAMVWLNRPEKLNALNKELIVELTAEINAQVEDESVRVIILAGKGKSFCSGADLSWFLQHTEGDYQPGDSEKLALLFQTIFYSPKPIIAAVHGNVFGGGVGLMAACDLVVAANTSQFRLPEVRLGISPSTIMPYLLFRCNPSQVQRNVILTDVLTALEAQSMHLVDIVTAQDLEDKSLQVADELMKGSPESLTESKKIIRELKGYGDKDAILHQTVDSLDKIKRTKNAEEGLRAFFDGRRADWK